MAGGWDSLGLMPELVQACEDDFNWRLPSDIQDEAIPLLLGGCDVMGSAETGSGKTAAFALPILQLCVEYKEKGSNQPAAAGCGPPDDEKGKGKQQHQLQSLEPKFAMSTNDRDPSIAFHPDGNGLQLQSRDTTKWAGCRCFTGIRVVSKGNGNQSSNKQTGTTEEGSVKGYSFECTVLDKTGLVRLGWSSDTSSLQLGTDAGGYGYGGTGMKSHSNKYEAFPSKGKVHFSQGDVVGCHLKVFSTTAEGEDEPSKSDNTKAGGQQKNDIAASITFSKNGKMLGEAFKIIRTTHPLSLYPTICIKNSECEINFGGDRNKPLKYDLPEGFEALGAAVKTDKTTENSFVVNPCDILAFQLANQRNSKRRGPMAIVIEPTRDLAEQSYRAFADLGKRLQETPIQAALLVGGIKPTQTLGMLDQNEVDVLVGTPPIIASYMKKGTILASRCRFFVLDEADELISTDSVDHIRSIFGRIVASTDPNQSRFERLQVCFFSATLHSKEVRDLAASICSKPMWVDLRGKNDSILPDSVHHCVINITPTAPTSHRLEDDELIETDAVHRNGKLNAKIDLNKLEDKASRNSECIKQLKPRVILDVMDKFSMEQVLIFCRTNLDCDLMEKFLKKIGGAGGAGGIGVADKFSCRVLAGMRSMEERQKSLEDFKDGEVRILIATDVAARGIDISSLPFVINCTIPDKPETYVHRVGRVGRADKRGLAVSLVSTVRERVWFCKKGKKPPCADTRDFDKGGNCIWYDEPQFLNNIKSLLQKNDVSITKLDWPNLQLPADIQALVKSGGYGAQVKSGSALNPETKARMQKIEKQVKELSLTESSLQTDYWELRNKFSSIATK